MSVILTDMDIPNNCRECRFVIEKGDYRYCSRVADDGYRMRDVSRNFKSRRYDCPMRSVEELIKYIEIDFKSLDGMGYNKKILRCIDTIKEYCKEEQEE